MTPEQQRRVSIALSALVVGLVLLWLLAGVVLDPASAEALGIPLSLRSRIRASYSAQEGGAIARVLFSLGEEALRLTGLSPEEARARMEAYQASLLTPVATATALNFRGDAPFTATPTRTTTPTRTSTATATFTQTPTTTTTGTPTRTPTRTPTKTAGPTNTPAGADTVRPSILAAVFGPPPGPLNACVFDVVDMHVFDPAFSSGISGSNVFARVTYPDAYQAYNNLALDSGGFVSGPGSDWDAHYADAVNFKDPAHPVVDGESIFVELKVQDNAGTGWVITAPITFTLSGVDCD